MRLAIRTSVALALLSTAAAQSTIYGIGAPGTFRTTGEHFLADFTVLPQGGGFLPGMDFDVTATTLWAIDSGGINERGMIDLVTGQYTPVGLTSTSEMRGLTAAPDGATWYISNHLFITSNSGSKLHVGDITTGIFTPVGSITAGDDNVIDDIAIDSQGRLFGLNRLDDSLYSIDRVTGAGTPIGALGLDIVAGGMDFDWSTDTLYAVLDTDWNGSSVFASIDVVTGLATVLEDTASQGMLYELTVQEPLPTAIGALDPLCTPEANSTGLAATIELFGTGDPLDPIRARCFRGPAGQFGYFISGPNPGLYVIPPMSSGRLCIAAPQYRYSSVPLRQVFWFDSTGTSRTVVGGTASILPTDGSYAPVPAVAVSESRAFQAWYRDVGALVSNFSESRVVLFR